MHSGLKVSKQQLKEHTRACFNKNNLFHNLPKQWGRVGIKHVYGATFPADPLNLYTTGGGPSGERIPPLTPAPSTFRD